MRLDRHRAQHRLGDEGEGAFAADDQVQQDVDRAVIVGEGVQPVAHGVLDRVLAADLLDRRRVVAHPVAQGGQARPQPRVALLQLPVGVGRAGVEDGAARQHQHGRLDGVVDVEFRAAGHAAGVVGDHPAERAGRLAGRVRSQPAAVPGQPRVDLPNGRAGLDTYPQAPVEDLDGAEVAAGVEQQRLGRCLPGQARTAGAEADRQAQLARQPHQPGQMGGVGDGDHAGRDHPVVRGVVGEREPVGGPGPEGPGPEPVKAGGEVGVNSGRAQHAGRLRRSRGSGRGWRR